jgi:hypothetical protein
MVESDIKLPKEIWSKRLLNVESVDEMLVLLDEIEGLDAKGDFHFRLIRCREIAKTEIGLMTSISLWAKNKIHSYLVEASRWNEGVAKQNSIRAKKDLEWQSILPAKKYRN